MLMLAAVVGVYWWQRAPEDWLPILVSVLVVTCPCALSLATPTAVSAATGTMLARGLLMLRGHSLETLAHCTHVVFDKTGTLTQNQMQVMRLWAGGKAWKVTGQGFDPAGTFVDADGNETDAAGDDDLRPMLAISAYCNEARLAEEDGRPSIQGNPTEGALVVAAAKAGISRAELKEQQNVRVYSSC